MQLTEKFGIKDFDNLNYLRCMKNIAKKVIETYNKISSSFQYDYNSTITLNNASDYYYDELIFTQTGVSWLSEIRINDYIGNKLPDRTYPFVKNFKHIGKYDSFSFDEFFSMLISRIYRIFIRHCINQYSSTTGSVTEKQEIKDKRMLFELRQRRARHHRRV